MLAVARYVVFGTFCVALLAAVGSWLVRTRRLSPFGWPGRTLRALTDPIVRPVEVRLVRAGGNPVNAGWWLVVGVMIVGVLLLSLLGWVASSARNLADEITDGPEDFLEAIVNLTYDVLIVAVIVRVVASWFGWFRYNRWMRPAYWLTDWIINPIRRLMPPAATFDLSPLVAWVVLWLMKSFILRVLL